MSREAYRRDDLSPLLRVAGAASVGAFLGAVVGLIAAFWGARLLFPAASILIGAVLGVAISILMRRPGASETQSTDKRAATGGVRKQNVPPGAIAGR
jgi:predicted lipid-binding transport protein (Tim44 family)